jgi:hypothetical protein
MLVLLLTSAFASGAPSDCDRTFHERLRPPGVQHLPPPLGPLLERVYDLDDSGSLDVRERAALDADQRARCSALADLFTAIDVDGDGVVSAVERRALVDLLGPPPPPPPPVRPPAGSLPPPLLWRYDADHDGSLSPEEWAVLRPEFMDRFRNGLPPIAREDRP